MEASAMQFGTDSDEVAIGDLNLDAFEGEERLSSLYRYSLTLSTTLDGGLSSEAIDDLLRQPCHILFGDALTPIHGRLAEIEMLSMLDSGLTRYRAVMVPKLWAASQIQRSRIFQAKTVIEILEGCLVELGLEKDVSFEMATYGTYPEREYTVQYEETDLAFLQRQMSHWGIYYYFLQEPDTERLVVTDSLRGHVPFEGAFEYRAAQGSSADPGVITTLTRRRRPRPGGVVLRDYNWRIPDVPLQGDAAADQSTGVGFHAHYGDHFKEPEEGTQLAAVRAQELMTGSDVFEMQCRNPQLVPGHVFELTHHPSGELDRGYLVTGIAQSAAVSGELSGYRKRLTAIADDRQFRPERSTPWPRIDGIMHARVDGEVPGLAAPIDSLGRYKVLLPWDMEGEMGGRASRWIRMAQPSSGPSYGIHFPLHIGVEVMLVHQGGDPDRPIIAGTVPNTQTVSPVVDENSTQSRIRTRTGILLEWDDDSTV